MRKAQLTEIFSVVIVIFVLAISSIFGSYFLTQFNTQLNNTTNDSSITNLVNQGNENFKNSIDGMVLVFAGILIVGAGILAFILPTHPIFIIISVISLFFLIPISNIIKDVYFDMTNQTVLNSTAVFYSNTNVVFSNLPVIFLIANIIFIIVMFLKEMVLQ